MKHSLLKILPVIVILTMVLCLAGCSDDSVDRSLWDSANVPGDKITTKIKSDADDKKHEVTYEITSVTTDEAKTKKAIDDYNLSAAGSSIGEIGSDKLVYGMITYKETYPKDFPDAEYGIRKTGIKFSIVNIDGSDKITVDDTEYDNLSETIEIGTQPSGYDFYSGDTYHGKCIFLIPKDYEDYLIKEGDHYIRPKK